MKITYFEAVCLTCVRHRVSVVIYFISRASLAKKTHANFFQEYSKCDLSRR